MSVPSDRKGKLSLEFVIPVNGYILNSESVKTALKAWLIICAGPNKARGVELTSNHQSNMQTNE